MSFCRLRGRPRLGVWIRESETRRTERSSSQPNSEIWSGGNAWTKSAPTARITRFSTAVHIQDAFRESKDSYLQFLGIAERRAIAVLPDHRLVWQNAFRLQHLLVDQEHLRFENLVANHQLDEASRSIASIEERLRKGWAATEEATLKESLSFYREISSEIEDIKSKWLPLGNELIEALEGDSEYRMARIALSESAQKRRAKLGG